jgi:hypothetical protein
MKLGFVFAGAAWVTGVFWLLFEGAR